MKIVKSNSYDEMSKKAADIVISLVKKKSNTVLGLATGSTPLGLYGKLVKSYKNGEISFKDVKTVNLDEYYPITPSNNQSYRYFMNKNLFNKIDILKENTHMLSGKAVDCDKECEEYENLISSLGGVDLQILGIGRNGHIAFNEPGDKLSLYTHKTRLTDSTIEANSRFFSSRDEVPEAALTMGIGTIMKAKRIIILASGEDKKEAVRGMLSPYLDTHLPASLLSLHNNVTLFCTEDVL